MKKNVKLLIFNVFGSIIEIFVLFVLAIISFLCRYKTNKSHLTKRIFIGMMHTNNMVFVAQAMRKKGYYVQVVPWLIPPHEEGIISYDVNLKKKYPILYSNFVGQYFLGFWVYVWAIFRFDIFLTPFQSRLLDRTVWLKWLEIPLLHIARKKVILNTFGGDVATPRLRRRKDLKYSLYDGYSVDPQYRIFNERAIARNTRILEKQADCIISAIDHIDYLDRVDEYFHLRCVDVESFADKQVPNNAIPVLIHAPNHRLVKGTQEIEAAIQSLNKRGIPCILKIIENTPHTKLMQIISQADVVIDQLLLGTYARLAIESMALGKPVLCYLREDLYEFNPIWKDCPIINVNPETIESTLEKILTSSREYWREVGEKGKDYIRRYHSYEYIGDRFDKIIKTISPNEIPEEK